MKYNDGRTVVLQEFNKAGPKKLLFEDASSLAEIAPSAKKIKISVIQDHKTQNKPILSQKEKIRTDPNQRKLGEFGFDKLSVQQKQQKNSYENTSRITGKDFILFEATESRSKKNLEQIESEIEFESVEERENNDLQNDIKDVTPDKLNVDSSDNLLSEEETTEETEAIAQLKNNLTINYQKTYQSTFHASFKSWVLIGLVNRNYFLVQENTTCVLVSVRMLLQDYFYKKVVRNIGKSVFEVVSLIEGSNENYEDSICTTLPITGASFQNAKIPMEVIPDMLKEYFQINLDLFQCELTNEIKAELNTVPNIIEDDIEPEILKKLCRNASNDFVLELFTKINYDEEYNCLDDLCRLVSKFSVKLLLDHFGDDKNGIEGLLDRLNSMIMKIIKSKNYVPDLKLMTDMKFKKMVANLSMLYSVFERC